MTKKVVGVFVCVFRAFSAGTGHCPVGNARAPGRAPSDGGRFSAGEEHFPTPASAAVLEPAAPGRCRPPGYAPGSSSVSIAAALGILEHRHAIEAARGQRLPAQAVGLGCCSVLSGFQGYWARVDEALSPQRGAAVPYRSGGRGRGTRAFPDDASAGGPGQLAKGAGVWTTSMRLRTSTDRLRLGGGSIRTLLCRCRSRGMAPMSPLRTCVTGGIGASFGSSA